jgi:hypothetical protein
MAQFQDYCTRKGGLGRVLRFFCYTARLAALWKIAHPTFRRTIFSAVTAWGVGAGRAVLEHAFSIMILIYHPKYTEILQFHSLILQLSHVRASMSSGCRLSANRAASPRTYPPPPPLPTCCLLCRCSPLPFALPCWPAACLPWPTLALPSLPSVSVPACPSPPCPTHEGTHPSTSPLAPIPTVLPVL